MLPAKIYLASRSPRRRALLNQAGIAFSLLPFRSSPREDSGIDETPLVNEAATDYALRIAQTKATHGTLIATSRKLPEQMVLAADTTLEFEGRIIGKPSDSNDAKAILNTLSGNTHRVITAVALSFRKKIDSVLSVSEVRFTKLTDEEIRIYVASGESFDKAGAYGIQGRAALFIEHLSGSYSGVMGLPLFETSVLLKRFETEIQAGLLR